MQFPLAIAESTPKSSQNTVFIKRCQRLLPKLLSCLCILLFLLPNASGQSRKELETRRKKLIADIKVTSKLLYKTEKNRTATLNRYVALQNQIKSREALLLTIDAEVQYLDASIQRNAEVISSLEEDMTRLEEEYGMMARRAQRLRMSNSRLLFIFSADGFNDALQRWQYLRQYDNYRKKQAQLIISTQATLADKVDQLENQKLEKQDLLTSEIEQKGLLEQEVQTKSTLLKALRNDEDRLRDNLASKRAAHQKLNTAIENTIRKEIIAQRKRARAPEALQKSKPRSADSPARIPATPSYGQSNTALTNEFRGNRGRLPWPVSSGVITSHFGKQAHPTLRKIQITNNGIDIQTNPKASVKAVFKGEVVGTQFIPGYHYMAILRHGNYYTVYSNLETVSVKRGEMVQSQQTIGRVAVDAKTGQSEVHFEVWRDKLRLNPTDWVKR